MLYPLSDYVITSMKKQKVAEYLHESEVDRLVLHLRVYRQSWLSAQACNILHVLGHLLLAIGKRLDGIEVTPALLPRESPAQSGLAGK